MKDGRMKCSFSNEVQFSKGSKFFFLLFTHLKNESATKAKLCITIQKLNIQSDFLSTPSKSAFSENKYITKTNFNDYGVKSEQK